MSGFTDKVTGKAKEMAGDVTGNHKLEAEGELQQVKGKAEDIIDDTKRDFQEKIDHHGSVDHTAYDDNLERPTNTP